MKNPDRCLFEEDKPVYRVINHALLNIGEIGFYDAIFTDEYAELEEDDQNMACGVVMAETGISIKEFVDSVIKEKLTSKKESPLLSARKMIRTAMKENGVTYEDIQKSIEGYRRGK